MKKININKDKLSGHAIALFTITVWGSTYVVSKHMLSFFTPPQMMVMRFILAYAALWAIRPKWSRPVWRDELGCFLMGLFGCTAYFLAENFDQKIITYHSSLLFQFETINNFISMYCFKFKYIFMAYI